MAPKTIIDNWKKKIYNGFSLNSSKNSVPGLAPSSMLPSTVYVIIVVLLTLTLLVVALKVFAKMRRKCERPKMEIKLEDNSVHSGYKRYYSPEHLETLKL